MLIRSVEEQVLNAQVLCCEDVALIFLNPKFVLYGVDMVFLLEKKGIPAMFSLS